MIPLMVRSLALVPSSAIVNVLAAPSATGEEMDAPAVPVVASLTVIFPPRVSVEEPVMDAPVVAPPSRVTLVGEPRVKVDIANVEPAVTVRAPVMVVLATRVTVLPGLLIVRLALLVLARPEPTSWLVVPL